MNPVEKDAYEQLSTDVELAVGEAAGRAYATNFPNVQKLAAGSTDQTAGDSGNQNTALNFLLNYPLMGPSAALSTAVFDHFSESHPQATK